MPDGTDDISLDLDFGFNRRWYVIPLTVGQDYALEMVPNPIFPRSIVSRRAFEELRARELLQPVSGRRYRMSGLRIAGYPVADLDVRVGPTAAILGVDGLLGLDFFTQFSAIHLDLRSWRLTLIDP